MIFIRTPAPPGRAPDGRAAGTGRQAAGTGDGRAAGTGSGADVLGHPLAALAWLANRLIAQGKALQGGQVVLTGTMVDPVWLESGASEAVIEIERLGRAKARFA